jgi:hypothetical protein
MSARLNFNAIRYVSWKGKTFKQISSSIQKNSAIDAGATNNYMRAMPLKIYRREIAIDLEGDSHCKNSRISYSVDEFSRPNGVITRSFSAPQPGEIGLINTLDINYSENKYENGSCQVAARCQEDNAKRRVRSSGMIRKKFDPSRGDSAYFTDSAQYMTSRTKTFKQNLYTHVRYGDSSLITTPSNKDNMYSPNGLSHCPKIEINSTNNTFYYLWIDYTYDPLVPISNSWHQVVIPDGFYDVKGLNNAFENVMIMNKHYYENTITGNRVLLMKIIYNHAENKIELQAYSTTMVSNGIIYKLPYLPGWSNVIGRTPVFYIPNNGIQSVIGFSSAYYPDIAGNNTINQSVVPYAVLSNMSHSIYPMYAIMNYNPNNTRFAQQGGVSSSAMTARKKYDTITTNGGVFDQAYGRNVANAMAYGVSDSVYSIKDKIGFPVKKTPVIDKYTGELKKCENTHIRG